MNEATEDQRDALARLLAAGGSVKAEQFGPLLEGTEFLSKRLFGVRLFELSSRGLVMVTDDGRNITITSMGRALAKEKP